MKAKTATKKTSKKKDIIVKPQIDESIISSLILNGDVSKMSQDEKAKYNIQLCKSLGLNPLTQPFQILKLNGKEVLYATKSATKQLRKARGVSVVSLDRKVENDICVVTAVVSDHTGRTDAATGAVNIRGLSGDALANAIMKSETKAKRRATLSICGLGFLDESEIETIPGARVATVTSEEKIDDIMTIENACTAIASSKDLYELHKKVVSLRNVNWNEDDKSALNKAYSERVKQLNEVTK